ncbi:MAG: hypothetical protein V3S08_06225 [Phycisphaerales bacterium]
MKFEGKRVSEVRWIHAGPCVVRVEVEAVFPTDDPSEACIEPETVEFLREVHERAEAGDVHHSKPRFCGRQGRFDDARASTGAIH